MPPLLYQWIDLLWLPVAVVAAHKGHRLMAMGFVLICAFSLRLQVELMGSIGHAHGIAGLLHATAYTRGLIIYGLAIGFFLLLAFFSPRTYYAVFIAAALGVYLAAFALSMIVMAL